MLKARASELGRKQAGETRPARHETKREYITQEEAENWMGALKRETTSARDMVQAYSGRLRTKRGLGEWREA